jgi:hypothetical protein
MAQVNRPEQITQALTNWLEQEIINADTGRNAYLSDYQDRHDDLYKPFDDPTNLQALKTLGHHNRFVHWVRPYAEAGFAEDDWFAARITFACLMNISGAYRTQCFLESSNEADYTRRRYEQPSGIDIGAVAADELRSPETNALSAMDPDIRLAHIIGRSLKTNDRALALHKTVQPWIIDNHKAGSPLVTAQDMPVESMLQVQRLWTGLAVAHIVVAASIRDGDYQKVPFLEPKSITDVTNVQYPLAG